MWICLEICFSLLVILICFFFVGWLPFFWRKSIKNVRNRDDLKIFFKQHNHRVHFHPLVLIE